jgi:hypothetical protein
MGRYSSSGIRHLYPNIFHIIEKRQRHLPIPRGKFNAVIQQVDQQSPQPFG